MKAFKNLSLLLFMSLLLHTGCGKNKDCYSRQLEVNHSGFCPDNCPGVCGCDGKTYCNECYAAREGIMTVSKQPCN